MLLLSTTISYIRTRLAGLRAREDGVTAVEYALMVAIIALLMVAGFYFLFTEVGGAFDNAGDCVANPGEDGCPEVTTATT
jgi:Flp pilus assembly pilin Flp